MFKKYYTFSQFNIKNINNNRRYTWHVLEIHDNDYLLGQGINNLWSIVY
jgi:hypothetical protein